MRLREEAHGPHLAHGVLMFLLCPPSRDNSPDRSARKVRLTEDSGLPFLRKAREAAGNGL